MGGERLEGSRPISNFPPPTSIDRRVSRKTSLMGARAVSRKRCDDERRGSVPETDTGGWAQVCQGVRENPREGTRQYNGRNFGIRPARQSFVQAKLRRVAANDAKRLFTKNTGPCEAERQCIGADAWPVSER